MNGGQKGKRTLTAECHMGEQKKKKMSTFDQRMDTFEVGENIPCWLGKGEGPCKRQQGKEGIDDETTNWQTNDG